MILIRGQTDSFSQEIQIESHPTDEETSRNRQQTDMILFRGQTDSYGQEIQVETQATTEETSRNRPQTYMILVTDNRPTPSTRRYRLRDIQQMKRQAETDDRQI
jgi:hypothetical protein